MALYRVDDLLSLINRQIKIQEDLYECLAKLSAMIEVVQGDGFLNQTPATIYHYFWLRHEVAWKGCSALLIRKWEWNHLYHQVSLGS